MVNVVSIFENEPEASVVMCSFHCLFSELLHVYYLDGISFGNQYLNKVTPGGLRILENKAVMDCNANTQFQFGFVCRHF